MALKDWKQRAYNIWWIKGKQSILLIEVMAPNKKEVWWGIRFSVGGFDNIPQTSLIKKYKFRTKKSALTYAKKYMRTH